MQPTERFKSSAVEESSIAFDSLESNVHILLIDWKGTTETLTHPLFFKSSFGLYILWEFFCLLVISSRVRVLLRENRKVTDYM